MLSASVLALPRQVVVDVVVVIALVRQVVSSLLLLKFDGLLVVGWRHCCDVHQCQAHEHPVYVCPAPGVSWCKLLAAIAGGGTSLVVFDALHSLNGSFKSQ